MSRAIEGALRGSTGFLARAAIQLCLLGVTITATRTLAIADFGAFAIASAFMLLSRNLLYVGPYEYLLKTTDEAGVKSACLAANIALAGASAVGLAGVAAVSPWLFSSAAVEPLLLALIPAVFIAASTSWYEALLLRAQRVRTYYALTVTGDLIGSGVAITLLVSGWGPVSLVAQIYGRLVTLLVSYALVTRQVPLPFAPGSKVREIIGWSSSRYGATSLNFLSNYGADLVLGIVLSPAATGIYRAGNRIVSALTDLFAQPLLKMSQANVSARVARGLPIDRSWLTMFHAVASIAWAALAALAVSADQLVPIVLGAKWADAAGVVLILCVLRATALIDATTTSVLIASDRQRYTFRLQAMTGCAALLAAVALAPYGVIAVTVGSGLALSGLSAAFVREAARLSGATKAEVLETIGAAMIPALVVAAALELAQQIVPPTHYSPLAALGVGAATAGFALAGVLWAMRGRLAQSLSTLAGIDGRAGAT